MVGLEAYFQQFRKNIIGNNIEYPTPYGVQKMLYADWVASGRLYRPVELALLENFGPFVGNTHTETSEAGTRMTLSYHFAHEYIKKHVHAGGNDVIITAGFGMTSVVNKLQRILGLRGARNLRHFESLTGKDKPVVFITHMEHHSNQTSWYETLADVVVLEPDQNMLVNPDTLKIELEKYKDRSFKIGAFTACSNVTGIITPYHQLAAIMHEHGGVCFVDFAASAPYVDMDMHPANPLEKLDAIYFSPHKFLGGPGSSGVLVFDSSLYKNDVPDEPGGGTVDWTNPWGNYKYVDSIEAREDGGTPGFLQAIRTALSIKVKEEMGTKNMRAREDELLTVAFSRMRRIPGIRILAEKQEDRLGILSFYHPGIHYNLFVKLLSDRFGIQTRGGCACAGTYGHYLLQVSHEKSMEITEKITHGDLSDKPGWVRLSLHPTMTDDELLFIIQAIGEIAAHYSEWMGDYTYCKKTNEFINCRGGDMNPVIEKCFTLKD
jgi:selenocysteine lyase/cysteine desulfurase